MEVGFMKKAMLVFVLVFLISTGIAAAAADLSTYPSPFISGSSFDAQIIVGSNSPATDTLAASDIAVALQQISENRITAVLEDEYDSSKNSILIGLPCHNPILASVLGTTACDFGLPNDSGYLKIVEKNGLTNLIVSGKTSADTRKAARALANYRKYGLMGKEVLIVGTLDEPLVQKLQVPIEVKAGPTAPAAPASQGTTACNSDADCTDDKWCLAGTCRSLGCPEGTIAKSHDCIKEAKTATSTSAAARNETKNESQKPVAENPGFFAKIINFFKSLFSRK